MMELLHLQAIFGDIAQVLSRQYVIVPNATGNDAVMPVKLHMHNSAVNREATQQ